MSARRKERTEEESVEEEDFEEAMKEASSSTVSRRKLRPFKQQIIPKIPESVDDFLRNFLQRAGLNRTLKSFEAEWYSSAQRHLAESLKMATTGVFFLPDAVTHRQLLQSELQRVHRETDLLRQEVLVAGESLASMQREREYHRLQCQRVTEDKNRLIEEFKQLKKHLESYQPALRQLDDKYEAALRQKMLISLKKGTEVRLNQEKSKIKEEKITGGNRADKSPARRPIIRHENDTEFPICSRPANTHLAQVKSETLKSTTFFSLSCSIRAHQHPISCIDLHPRKRILASASDDCSWRLLALPSEGEKVSERCSCLAMREMEK